MGCLIFCDRQTCIFQIPPSTPVDFLRAPTCEKPREITMVIFVFFLSDRWGNVRLFWNRKIRRIWVFCRQTHCTPNANKTAADELPVGTPTIRFFCSFNTSRLVDLVLHMFSIDSTSSKSHTCNVTNWPPWLVENRFSVCRRTASVVLFERSLTRRKCP